MSGVIATIATTPKASCVMLPPTALQSPIASGSRNVAVIAPEATPPESKAMAVNIGGTMKLSISAIVYPGTMSHIRGSPVKIRIIASPTEMETPIDLIPHKGKAKKIDVAMSNSFGFGGTNAAVIFKKVD